MSNATKNVQVTVCMNGYARKYFFATRQEAWRLVVASCAKSSEIGDYVSVRCALSRKVTTFEAGALGKPEVVYQRDWSELFADKVIERFESRGFSALV